MTPALSILARCTISETSLTIPGYLPADEFSAVRQHIERLNGRYNQPGRCFTLPPGVAGQLRMQIAAAQEAARRPASVPMELAKLLVTRADVKPGMTFLGRGNVALAAKEVGARVCCIEPDEDAAQVVRGKLDYAIGDFMTLDPAQVIQFDRAVIVPRIRDDADCRTVLHAYRFLKPGGKLVAVMLPSFQYPGGTVPRMEMRELVRPPRGAVLDELPPGTLDGEAAGLRMAVVGIIK